MRLGGVGILPTFFSRLRETTDFTQHRWPAPRLSSWAKRRISTVAAPQSIRLRQRCPHCHPDRSEPSLFLRVRFWANAWARAVEGSRL